MTTAIAGLVTGISFGALLASGKICFNAGLRQAAFEGRPTVLRVFGVIVAVELLALPVLLAFGVAPLQQNIDAGAPSLLPVAQLSGGLVFGVGMALAGGCITGILWKSGAGSIATALAIAGFAAGELLIRGPGSALVADLDDAWRPSESSLTQVSGISYEVLAPIIGTIALFALIRHRRDGLALGIGLGVAATLAWAAADLAGYGYGLGFVGLADGTRTSLAHGGELPFQLYLALGVLAGGALVVRGPLRTPDAARATRAIFGGVLMGVGANLAHGCNIGHAVTGVGLLSLGSVVAVTAMACGALLSWRYLLRPLPALRGTERPAAVDW